MIKRIRFPAEWRDDKGRQHQRIADFKLGLGSCGKIVTNLDAEINEMGTVFEITQETNDFEIMTFVYPIHTILGRIEITQ